MNAHDNALNRTINQLKNHPTKNEIQQAIQQLRKDFQIVMILNMSLPPSIRIGREEVNVDIALEGAYLESYHREMREINKNLDEELRRSKIERFFLENSFVECMEYNGDGFAVDGLKNKILGVNSFLVLKPADQMHKIKINLISQAVNDEKKMIEKSVNGLQSNTPEARDSSCCFIQHNGGLDSGQNKNDITARGTSRKAMRKKRRDDIKTKIANTPQKTRNSDVLEARNETNMKLGNRDLKFSPSFKVPIKKQMDVKAKIDQMIQCELLIHKMKMKFNEDLIKLQSTKTQLVERIQYANKRLMRIGTIDGETTCLQYLFSPKSPGNDMKVDTEKLARWKETIYQRLEEDRHDFSTALSQMMYSKASRRVVSSPSMLMVSVEADDSSEIDAILRDERSRLMEHIKEAVDNFDKSLFVKRKKYFQMALEIKMGGLELVAMLEELKHLSCMETKGRNLITKRNSCLVKSIELSNLINSQKARLDEKKAQLDLWVEKEKNLLKTFSTHCPPSYPHYFSLHRVFSRKEKIYDDDDNSYCDEDDDEDLSLNSDDGDFCPDGCPEEKYESILELRQTRLMLEKELKAFQREMSIIKRNYDQFCMKEKQAQREIDEAELQIRMFQNKKQQTLNDVASFMPMTSKQMHLWKPQGSECDDIPVIFSRKCLKNLYEQAHVLTDEITADILRMNDLKDNKKRMEKEKRELTESTTYLQEQCKELQILKFGQLVDIEGFDELPESAHGKRSSCVRYRDHAHEHDRKHEQEEARLFREKFKGLKSELKHATEENTRILSEIVTLHQTRISMESKATKRELIVEVEDAIEISAKYKEACQIKKTILQQNAEIARLKTQVYRLRRKEGCIYAQS